jgi:hypothetical protein
MIKVNNGDYPAIYKIQNTETGKAYIGAARKYVPRMNQNISRLVGGYHHNKALQMDFDNNGIDSFCFTPVVVCEEWQIVDLERKVVGMFSLKDGVYNRLPHCDYNGQLKTYEEHVLEKKYYADNKHRMVSFEDVFVGMELYRYGHKHTVRKIDRYKEKITIGMDGYSCWPESPRCLEWYRTEPKNGITTEDLTAGSND